MPTANPRVSVTLTPETAAILRKLSTLTGESVSATVGDLLRQSVPVFERMVKVLEAAHRARETLRSEVADGLEQAQNKLESQFGLMLSTIDEGVRPILEEAEAIARRSGRRRGGDRAAGGAGAADAPKPAPTPLSNRGVTPTRKAKKSSSAGSRVRATKRVQA